jgi:hypothetical protein
MPRTRIACSHGKRVLIEADGADPGRMPRHDPGGARPE